MADVKEMKTATVLLEQMKVEVDSENEESALNKTLRSCCIIPQRYILGLMSLLGICNAYTMRVCINVAITQMVSHQKNLTSHNDPYACPSEEITKNTTYVEKNHATFDWDEKTQGLILSGFYMGYVMTPLLGAHLSEKYGGKWVVGIGLFITAVFTVLTPAVVKSGGATWLIVLRILQGMGEGPTMSGLMMMLSKWVPPHERSTLGVVVFGGAQVGNIFGSAMSGVLLSGGRDWAYVFYFFGGCGTIWCILWLAICYNSPSQHPFISRKEKDYLKETVTKSGSKHEKDPVPWKAILRSSPVIALLFGAIGHDWGYFTMVSDLPKYSHDVLKFNIKNTGYLTSLPFVAMWLCSFPFGLMGDYVIKKKIMTIRWLRIMNTSIAAIVPAICIILASYSGCNRTAAMVCFVVSMAFMGAYYSGMKVNPLDLSPNYAASVTSLVNTVSTCSGMLSPYIIGLLTPESTLAQWRIAFWLCFGVMLGTTLVYAVLSDGKQQWWDDVEQFGYPTNWKHGPLSKRLQDKDGYAAVNTKEEKLENGQKNGS